MSLPGSGKPQQQHKKQASKVPAAVGTGALDLYLEDEDVLKGIDMTLLHRRVLLSTLLTPSWLLLATSSGRDVTS